MAAIGISENDGNRKYRRNGGNGENKTRASHRASQRHRAQTARGAAAKKWRWIV
jgi:hypothetical protein